MKANLENFPDIVPRNPAYTVWLRDFKAELRERVKFIENNVKQPWALLEYKIYKEILGEEEELVQGGEGP